MKGLKRCLPLMLVLALIIAPAAFASDAGGSAGDGSGEEVPSVSGGLFQMLIMFVPLIAVFYFLIIRPESKRKKAAAQLRSDLIVSDEVTTLGGIVGKVVQIKDDTITIETSAERTRITVLRGAISSRTEKISE